MAIRIDILTLFPEMFAPVLGTSIPKRAAEKGLVSYHLTNIRDFATDGHKSVDDKPFGGGPGMVMMCQTLFDAVEHIEKQDPRPATRILLSPQGRLMDQTLVEEFSRKERLLLIAGHYEGFDERIIDGLSPMELSIGDYVLSGGEVAAMVLIDAIVRLLPGALGAETGAADEGLRQCDARVLEHVADRRAARFSKRTLQSLADDAELCAATAGSWAYSRADRRGAGADAASCGRSLRWRSIARNRDAQISRSDRISKSEKGLRQIRPSSIGMG